MKKYINLSFIYAVAAMVCGVFYREFTKFNGFSGKTTLSIAHTHLFVLGTILFLIIGIIYEMSDLKDQKYFKRFNYIYNIGLPFMVVMFMVRGIIQTLQIELSNSTSAMISGVAGISHILIGISIVFLFIALKNINTKIK